MRRFDVRSGIDRDTCRAVIAILREQGVIAAPTETVYGLMTLWSNQAGRERIFEMKRRPRQKHLQMLSATLRAAREAGVRLDEGLRALARAFWPGPLTVVCAADDGATVGLRIPAHDTLLTVLRDLDDVLAATSANLSGQPPALDAAAAVRDLVFPPDAVLDGGTLLEGPGQASTVIDVTGGAPLLLREGPVGLDDITKVWHSR